MAAKAAVRPAFEKFAELISGELLPLSRRLNGEMNVMVPPPAAARPAVGFVYWKVRGPGTAVMVNEPLYPATPAPEIVTTSPTERPCAATVLTVTVLPTSVRPGLLSVIVPPPETGSPETGFV